MLHSVVVFFILFTFSACQRESIDNINNNASVNQPVSESELTTDIPDNFLPTPKFTFGQIYGVVGGGKGSNHPM